MMRYTRLEHRFVQHIPDVISPGVLLFQWNTGLPRTVVVVGAGKKW